MILILPFVLFLSTHFQINLLAPLVPISQRLNSVCTRWFEPKNPKSLDLSRSFICGQNVTHRQQKVVLQKSGLYHAIVVSGGHFLFIESALRFLASPRWLRFIALGLYFLTTGLQAPGLRCLMQLGLTSLSQARGRRVGSLMLCFYSGLACLVVAAPLWSSLSFWLSFAVALALSYSHELWTQKTRAFQLILPIILIYLFLIPFNFSKGYLHPLNLLIGMLLLYPFCCILLISAILLMLSKVFDYSILYIMLETINKYLLLTLQKWTLIVPDKNHLPLDIFYFWAYLFCLVCGFYLLILLFRRDTIHE